MGVGENDALISVNTRSKSLLEDLLIYFLFPADLVYTYLRSSKSTIILDFEDFIEMKNDKDSNIA